jgi:hypothetical protein
LIEENLKKQARLEKARLKKEKIPENLEEYEQKYKEKE